MVFVQHDSGVSLTSVWLLTQQEQGPLKAPKGTKRSTWETQS